MDQLLNGGMPLSHTHGDNDDDPFEDGSTLVDYNSEESNDNRAGDNDGFGVDLSDHPDYLAQDEARGNEQFTTHVAGDNRSEGQPSAEQLAASEQATTPEIRHENVMNAEIRHENVMNAEIRRENVMNAEIRHENVMNAEIRHENVVNARDKPVLTQQAIMEIIKRQPQAVMQKVGWEQKKQTYRDLLSGYESPNGTSMNVAVGLTALMFGSAVSEHAQMISILAQSEASDKLAKQAERHRELLEKEFTQSMERMKAEHEKTISEAIKSRDKYARSAHEAANSVEHTMQKIDQAQCDKVINFQLECLRKRALRSEQELQEVTEKFEEEIRQKETACDNQRKDLAKERKKNKDLEKELRDYEDSVMSGIVPKAAISRKSPDSSLEVPKPKRIRKDMEEVSRDKKATTLDTSMTTAYTETPRDNSNLKVMTKDPSSIRPSGHQAAEQTMEETSARTAPQAWTNQESSTAAV